MITLIKLFEEDEDEIPMGDEVKDMTPEEKEKHMKETDDNIKKMAIGATGAVGFGYLSKKLYDKSKKK